MALRCISVSSTTSYYSTRHKRTTGFVAFTTIGYGDLAPQTALGRAIFVFWALFGVGAMTVLIAGTSSKLRVPILDGLVCLSSFRCLFFRVSQRHLQ
jgi:Ion channel